ncbi:hypothetical protein APY94_03505 [Thermococcus celericrescens]|uniref:Class III signal peptide-containing protein n=1 Tax=Thermococcus celericrescens TaxID=227598 RepID=A0A100XYV5_9EURY|nr:class III signal peptide-containing protein [Thermococcus celericrescens]KUH34051.1 hypothetical protein APY94_03505 [Thermococcus celericrescens]
MIKKSNTGRAQISLEFLFIFGLLTILLIYSVRNVSFSEGSPSIENLRIQIALEEKSLANAISNTISQVYAQGPGSKATTYVKLTYLKNIGYVERASGVKNPAVFITYCNMSGRPGTYVFITNKTAPFEPLTTGDDKNVFHGAAIYSKKLSNNSSIWRIIPSPPFSQVSIDNPSGQFSKECGAKSGSTYTLYGIIVEPADLPSELRIVVEWNPNRGDSWSYNTTAKELRININPGG